MCDSLTAESPLVILQSSFFAPRKNSNETSEVKLMEQVVVAKLTEMF